MRENELILAEEWNPIIPQSINSKIEEVLSYTALHYMLWKSNDHLFEVAHRYNELSEAIRPLLNIKIRSRKIHGK